MTRTSHHISIVSCPVPAVTQMVTPNTLTTFGTVLYANAPGIRRDIAQSDDQQFFVTLPRLDPKHFGRRVKDSNDIVLRRLRKPDTRHYLSGPISLA